MRQWCMALGMLALAAGAGCSLDDREGQSSHGADSGAPGDAAGQQGPDGGQGGQGGQQADADSRDGGTTDASTTPGDRDAGDVSPGPTEPAWRLIDSPCTDSSQLALLMVDRQYWLAGCKGSLMGGEGPRGTGLFRTRDGGQSWQAVEGWQDVAVRSMALSPDGAQVIVGGQRFRLGPDGLVTACEVLWRAAVTDPTLTRTVLHEGPSSWLRDAADYLAVTPSGKIHFSMMNMREIYTGSLTEGFSARPAGFDRPRVYAMGETVVSPTSERASSAVKLLTQRAADSGRFFDETIVYTAPGPLATFIGMRWAEGRAYLAGLVTEDNGFPLIFTGEGDLAVPENWKTEKLDIPYGGATAIDVRGDVTALVGTYIGMEPARVWVAISRDNRQTWQYMRPDDIPDMSRNLGDGSVDVERAHIDDEGAIYIWGTDMAPNSGGYIARYGR